MIRGKSYRQIAFDISEGYLTVNPIFLKPLDNETIRELHDELNRYMTRIRTERLPANDPKALRIRNLRLQRVNLSIGIMRTFARQRRRINLV